MSVNDNRCAQCGQRQDEDPSLDKGQPAPMIHVAMKGIYSTADDLVSFHLDCMPYEVEAAHREKHGDAIDAAKSGKRGDDLLKVVRIEAAKHLKSGRDVDVAAAEQEASV